MAENINIKINATPGDFSGFTEATRQSESFAARLRRLAGFGSSASSTASGIDPAQLTRYRDALDGVNARARQTFETLLTLGQKNRDQGFLGVRDQGILRQAQDRLAEIRRATSAHLQAARQTAQGLFSTLRVATPEEAVAAFSDDQSQAFGHTRATYQAQQARIQALTAQQDAFRLAAQQVPTGEISTQRAGGNGPGVLPLLLGSQAARFGAVAGGVGLAGRALGSFWGQHASAWSQTLGIAGAALGAGTPLTALGGGAIGFGAGLVAGGIADITSKVLPDKEQYEERSKLLLQTGKLLNEGWKDLGPTLDDIRKRYTLFGAEATRAMHGVLLTTGSLDRSLLDTAGSASLLLGIDPGHAGQLAGALSRLTTSTGASLFARGRAAADTHGGTVTPLPISELLDQATAIAGLGGAFAPPLPESVPFRQTAFLGQLGPRFQGQQANVAQALREGFNTPQSDPVEAMRIRALRQLGQKLPGGRLQVAPGESLDLRTMSGLEEAMQIAGDVPAIQEQYVRYAEQQAGSPEEKRLLIASISGQQKNRRLARMSIENRRQGLGAEGFNALYAPLPRLEQEEQERQKAIDAAAGQAIQRRKTLAEATGETSGMAQALSEAQTAAQKALLNSTQLLTEGQQAAQKALLDSAQNISNWHEKLTTSTTNFDTLNAAMVRLLQTLSTYAPLDVSGLPPGASGMPPPVPQPAPAASRTQPRR